MNDQQIRAALHTRYLRRYHNHPETLVIDELGLQHGKSKADIAVINGQLNGYEIKSDVDSLVRLNKQIGCYSAVFDYTYLIVTDRHISKARKILPDWWGVILARHGPRGGINFKSINSPSRNLMVDDYSVAQLLWSNEAREILFDLGVRGSQLRKKRSLLYENLVNILPAHTLRLIVRERLKRRQNWRNPMQLSLNDD